jgi:hypothetical protein
MRTTSHIDATTLHSGCPCCGRHNCARLSAETSPGCSSERKPSIMAQAALAMTVLVISMIVTPMNLAMTVSIDPIAILESVGTMISTRAAG